MVTMLVAWAAALALVGAPADASISCTPALAKYDGYAYIAERRVEVGVNGCAALLLSAMSPRERRRTQALNWLSLDWVQGEGLIVLAHEAAHLAVGSNECRAEAVALRVVPALIREFVPQGGQRIAVEAAREWDARLPLAYHTDC